MILKIVDVVWMKRHYMLLIPAILCGKSVSKSDFSSADCQMVPTFLWCGLVLINKLNKYMEKFNQDFKVTLVIVYKRYHANGINSWFYTEEEFRHEIDSFWTMQDELRCFKKHWLLRLDKIVTIRHEFEYVNKSRNHHNKCKEIVVDDILDF